VRRGAFLAYVEGGHWLAADRRHDALLANGSLARLFLARSTHPIIG
jgi:hypothetical protein